MSTHPSEKTGYESTHNPHASTHIDFRLQNRSGKRLCNDTYALRVDTRRVHESTHPIMCRLILSRFCFTGARKSYVSMHSSMGRHIAVQNAVFLLFYTVFTLFSLSFDMVVIFQSPLHPHCKFVPPSP